MSLYREARGRRLWPLAAVAVVAAAIGLGVGLLVGGSGETDLAEALEPMQTELRAALSSLELVPIEYEQGQGEGTAAAETEDEAAAAHLDRARASFEAAESDLNLVDPEGAAAASETLDALDAAIAGEAPAAEVESLTADAEAAIGAAAGIEH